MPIAAKTQPCNKPETPFGKPSWPWNHVPTAGIPTRQRCQSIVSDQEADAGAKLIADYREWEAISAANDIESRQIELTRLKGIGLELKKREIAACDYDKWVEAQAKLSELRAQAFEMAKSLLNRLIEGLNSELNENAIASERRLDAAGLPIKNGAEWLLHEDVLCCALWSQRSIASKTLTAVSEVRDGIGSIQWFCTGEPGVPFQWAA